MPETPRPDDPGALESEDGDGRAPGPDGRPPAADPDLGSPVVPQFPPPPPLYGVGAQERGDWGRRTTSRGPLDSPYASYGARVGGWLIDWVITSIIGSIALIPLHAVHQAGSTVTTGAQPKPILGVTITNQGALLFVLFVMIYTTAFTGSSRGQTLGMMAVRVKVVGAVSGGPIGHGRALGRVVIEYVFLALLLVPWVLDMLFPLWDPRRQTLHDKVTNTVVVKT